MTILEKVAYIKGLIEGMNLNENDPTTKLFTVIVDVLDDMALEVEDIQEHIAEVEDYVAEVDEDLEQVEDYLDEECDCDDCDYDCDCGCDDYFTIVCSSCGEEFFVDDDVAQAGETKCPSCGEELEFDLSDLTDEDAAAMEETDK